MKTIHHLLVEIFDQASKKAFPILENFQSEIAKSSNEKFGNYQFNSSMKLGKLLQKPPRQIADEIVKYVESEALISKLEVAGPGFINIFINTDYLETIIPIILKDSHLGVDTSQNSNEKVIIDFSSPNTAKEMHVGHLRSTIIGDCLARLFEFLNVDVLRLNHIGDWGTAFGMLIAYIRENKPGILEGKEAADLPKLMQMYKLSKQLFDEDPEFKTRSRLQVVALQGGEKDPLKAWEIICDISRRAYQEIYDLLDIKITERGESFYNPMLKGIVKELEDKGLVTESNGAKCIFIEGFQNREGEPLPLMIQKSDGGYNYDTTDMATIKNRIQDEKGTRLIYVTDAGQATHFAMIEKAAIMAGYLDPKKVKVNHVPFGLVLGPDGKKFKTRSGETEKLIDLILTAIDEAEKILAEKNPEMKPDEIKALAKALGIGAIKYADLSCNRVGDYTFSYDRMLRFEGNTAAFLMYSYVRVISIQKKVNADIQELLTSSKISLKEPSEIALALHLAQFGETLETMQEDLLPNRLTDYLYSLAEKFNAFYRDCPIIGSSEQNSRLLLADAVAKTMKTGFEILGLPIVDRM